MKPSATMTRGGTQVLGIVAWYLGIDGCRTRCTHGTASRECLNMRVHVFRNCKLEEKELLQLTSSWMSSS